MINFDFKNLSTKCGNFTSETTKEDTQKNK